MPKLKWLCSYETLKFDTPDGDIHKGQYAIHEGRHIVRLHPENNHQFTILEAEDDKVYDIPKMIEGLTEVQIIEGDNMYYDEFELPDGRKYREASTRSKYRSLGVRHALPREKTVTNLQIDSIKEEDNQWR